MPAGANNFLTTLLGASAFWSAISGIAGAGIGYYSGTYKDNNHLVIALMQKDNSIDEKLKIIDELIKRGLLMGVSSERIQDTIAKNAIEEPGTVPEGLICSGIWCSLRGKIVNIKILYNKLHIYSGATDNTIDHEFLNATIEYQRMNNLPVDGIIGAKTFSIISENAKSFGIDM